MMAGGAELEALSHELAREMPESEMAQAMQQEVQQTLHTGAEEQPKATASTDGS
jgi:hypothetical protein